jgi:hypothetical protein
MLTNLAGVVTAGDHFKLFYAPAYSGSFSSIQPATPGVGLLWETNALAVNGTLAVVLGNANPQFGAVLSAGANLQFSGFGGAAGMNFSILNSTNLSVPIKNWNSVGSGTFDSSGHFSFTTALSPESLQQFFSLKIP